MFHMRKDSLAWNDGGAEAVRRGIIGLFNVTIKPILSGGYVMVGSVYKYSEAWLEWLKI